MTGSVDVDVQVASDVDSVPGKIAITGWLEQVIVGSGDSRNEVRREISVRIVDEDEGRELNRRYRHKDYATNVLSFPADCAGLPKDLPKILGDIVICGPVVEREAAEQGKDVASHWAHMLVHGALHLLGYDHEADDEAEIMEAMERKILAARGIEDPYAGED
jgi:probable rRNA maturation factor